MYIGRDSFNHLMNFKLNFVAIILGLNRISNRLGWTKQNTKTPEQTRKELEEWLPQCKANFTERLVKFV
jgi:endonuclease III